MDIVGVYDAKTHLPRLLNRVSRGEKIIITKHGVLVASLQPPEPEAMCRKPVQQVIAELREFRRKHRLSGLSIRELIDEGRR